MLLSCPICMVSFDQSSNIFCLPCGHLYHVTCTMQWFERTKTCPQCRKPTTEKKCVKVYPHIATGDSQNQSSSQMIETIDNLNLDIKKLQKNKKELESEKKTLLVELENLKDEHATTEAELNRTSSHNTLLKKQVKDLKNIETDLKAMRGLKEKADNELKLFKNVNKVLNGNLSEAQEALRESANSTDVTSILTMCNSLKRELLNCKAQRSHLKRTFEQEKIRFKETLAKLEKDHKAEVARLNIHLMDLEKEIVQAQKSHQTKKGRPSIEELNDSDVVQIWEGFSQKSTTSTGSADSTITASSKASTSTAGALKNRVLKPTNTNKVRVPVQKTGGIFGVSRLNASGTSGMVKRMHDIAANPPAGMTYDGLGRTVRAETAFKKSTAVKKIKL